MAAAIVRGAALLSAAQSLAADPDGYRALAQTLAQHGTYAIDGHPTAFRPPLYPLMLAVVEMLPGSDRLGIALLHWLMGVATVCLVAGLAQSAGLGRRWAMVAALLVAFDPLLIYWSRFVMTETLATLLAVIACTALHHHAVRARTISAAAAGATLALAALCRPVFLIWFALCVAATWWFERSPRKAWPAGSGNRLPAAGPSTVPAHNAAGNRCDPPAANAPARRTPMRHALAMAAAGALILSPWILRNAVQFGHFIPATTHGGYTLLLGNNRHFYEYLRQHAWGVAWQPDAFFEHYRSQKPPIRSAADEWRADRQAYRLAWQAIRREPAMFLYATGVRVARLWSPLPHQLNEREPPTRRWLRYGVAGWYTVELLLAIVGAWAIGKRWASSPWLWTLLLLLTVTGVHALYWSNLRMRAPLMPFVALLAAVGMGRTRKSCE